MSLILLYYKNDISLLDEKGYFEKVVTTNLNYFPPEVLEKPYYVQADIDLKSPGKRLVSFFDNKSSRTRAFILFYEDGSIYYKDNLKDEDKKLGLYTGLEDSKYHVRGEIIKFTE